MGTTSNSPLEISNTPIIPQSIGRSDSAVTSYDEILRALSWDLTPEFDAYSRCRQDDYVAPELDYAERLRKIFEDIGKSFDKPWNTFSAELNIEIAGWYSKSAAIEVAPADGVVQGVVRTGANSGLLATQYKAEVALNGCVGLAPLTEPGITCKPEVEIGGGSVKVIMTTDSVKVCFALAGVRAVGETFRVNCEGTVVVGSSPKTQAARERERLP